MLANPRPPEAARSQAAPLAYRAAAAWERAAYRATRPLARAYKQFTMRWSLSSGSWRWAGHVGATRRDYAAEVGDGRGNAIVAACIGKVTRAFPEAPATVYARTEGQAQQQAQAGQDAWDPRPDHALQRLLEAPNPYYSGLKLWAGTIPDYLLGNAYWLKQRSAAGRVVGLWWVPSHSIDPRWPETGGGTTFVSHYEYRVNGNEYRIPPEDVVHFRYGLDPDNPRKGLGPIGCLYREIATDNAAANWTASLLRNLGIPGVVFAPGDDVELSDEEAQAVKADFQTRFGGDRMGEPLIMRSKTQVSVLAFNPQQMVLRELRQVTEERISAVFGTPAVVVGLGAGLARSTYSNMGEAREDLYESLLVPMQRDLAADLQVQLLPDFGNPARLKVAFDLSQVRVLQEDQNELHDRVRKDLAGGVLTLNEARNALGNDDLPEGDVLYIPQTLTPTALDALLPEPEPVAALPMPAADTSGHGNGTLREGEREAVAAVERAATNGRNGTALRR